MKLDPCHQPALQAVGAFAKLDLVDTNVTDVEHLGFMDFQTVNVGVRS